MGKIRLIIEKRGSAWGTGYEFEGSISDLETTIMQVIKEERHLAIPLVDGEMVYIPYDMLKDNIFHITEIKPKKK
jgi:hypothetical protein